MTLSFGLFLDESGDFADRYSGEKRNSLVGGVLAPAGLLTAGLAKSIFDRAFDEVELPRQKLVHMTDMPADKVSPFVLSVFNLLRENNLQPVLIENNERVLIVDPDVTFLNILAEGITRLFEHLGAVNKKVCLNVLAARRLADDKKYPGYKRVLAQEEYSSRLNERLHWSWVRKGLMQGYGSWQVSSFDIGSAREDERLMLADVVCNAWYNRNNEKRIVPGQRDQMEIQVGRFYYTVLEHGSTGAVARLMGEGAIGEAMFETFTSLLALGSTQVHKEILGKKLKELLRDCVDRLAGMSSYGRAHQLSTLRERFYYLVHVERDLHRGRQLLELVQELLIPPLKEKLPDSEGAAIDALEFDLRVINLAIATHRGNLSMAEKQVQHIRGLLPVMASRWENLNAISEFFLREAVHLTNSYDFWGTIKLMNVMYKFIEETIELFPVALPQVFGEGFKSDFKGKVLGCRLQAYAFLGRGDPDYYQRARYDSDLAIAEFEKWDDLARHYLYRCYIETDSGNYADALDWLAKSLGLGPKSEIKIIAESLSADPEGQKLFSLMHYSRLMARSALDGEEKLAGLLYKGWTEYHLENHPFLVSGSDEHPAEILFWKWGSYLLVNGSIKAGQEKHARALKICFASQENDTLYTIGVGILAEQAAILAQGGVKYKNEYKSVLKALRDSLNKLLSKEGLLISLTNYFVHWPAAVEELISNPEPDKIVRRIRKLAHSVPY
ncbi:hypothetical protein Dtox_2970 [Desulfofarcimen acetoxidans DSM 771]|uniref:DUF3800 domain-containing protein n=1 Tax=Desulfofarcimen acetoxidans (strain ATCC 49208 / DSM 771 / KCTC 5769 / VKM B-1644 / 5575) TaxID=485916 RepID=C8W2P0_DESAS|nr:hypothetical protein [Desulfofarcimen acetoxidans]ACV63724.1 hypothetical protein Dtox_2970 [Desulfofarcimen acetoxidans DSM 771]